MPIRNTWRSGEHLIACDRCGTTYYSSQIRKEWTGLLVCNGPGTRQCWEVRHPVDYIKSVPDRQEVEQARPRNTTDLEACTASGRSAYTGMAIAGCSICGLAPEIDKESRI